MTPDLWCYNNEFCVEDTEPPALFESNGEDQENDYDLDDDLLGDTEDDDAEGIELDLDTAGLTLGQAGQQVSVQEYDLAELIAIARSEAFQPAVLPVDIIEITRITGTELLWHFDSWWDFVDTAEHGKSVISMQSRRSHEYTANNDRGTHTWQEAIDLARTGWPEGLRQAQPIFDLIHELIPTRRRRQSIEMSMVGPGRLDIVAYMTHQPEPWAVIKDLEPIDEIGHVVSVVINVAALASVSPAEMHLKGAVISGMIDLLETLDRRVELTLLMSSSALNGSGKCTFEIIVKRAEDALNQQLLIFALANPASFRRLGFSLREQLPQEWLRKMDVPYGYGMADEKPPVYPGAICIGGSGLNIQNNQIITWLQRTLASHGIEWKGE